MENFIYLHKPFIIYCSIMFLTLAKIGLIVMASKVDLEETKEAKKE